MEQRIETVFFEFQSTLPSQGATTLAKMPIKYYQKFQSTLPSQGATEEVRKYC